MIPIHYTTAQHQGKTIIGIYSAKRTEKDKHDRKILLNKTQNILQHSKLLQKKVKRYYLKQTGTKQYEIDR